MPKIRGRHTRLASTHQAEVMEVWPVEQRLTNGHLHL